VNLATNRTRAPDHACQSQQVAHFVDTVNRSISPLVLPAMILL
jgi:hypothetical protein